ncbi:MAG: helix-turn-helix transcriptional regulator [Parasporobacterium sp.]|nr:helix-turn-helix transcriptional regulator [Parasporobacterium sp.]
MGERIKGIAAYNSGAFEEWLHEESEHPYKFAPTRTKEKVVPFPAIVKCNTYILRHYGESIVEDIRQRMYEGDLALYFGVPDFSEDCMSLCDCRISPHMGFWWQNRYEFLADLEVYLEANVHTDEVQGRKSCTIYVTLAFCFDDQITYTFEGINSEQPDRDDIKLDDYLIPIMSYEEVETAAERQWLTYLAEVLHDRRFINAFQLARAMGLKIESHRLYHKPKTKSILYWTDTKVQVEINGDDGKTLPVTINISGGTIVTNESIVALNNRDLHIFHECFHAEYHWLFYRLQEMHNNDLRTIKKKRKTKNQGKEPKNPLPILEWEARKGSQALMMPRCISMPQFLEYAKEEQEQVQHAGWALENVGRRISYEWNVPKYLVKSRMLHLGYWQAQGALNYVQCSKDTGGYIRPFMFDRESCPTTSHTFVISPKDSFKLYEKNEEFRARIDTGDYVYVDGHFCLNDPAYLVQTPLGPRMTEWANRHVDECCLRFENVYEVDENYEFHLNYINSDEEYNCHYIDFIAQGRDLSEKEVTEQQSKIIASLPKKPGEALKTLMKLSGRITREQLAERALVSSGTVKNWRKEEYSYDPETAIRIIVALHLPPWISEWFLQISGVVLQFYGQHMMYRNIIACHYMDSLDEVNALLEAADFKRLKTLI